MKFGSQAVKRLLLAPPSANEYRKCLEGGHTSRGTTFFFTGDGAELFLRISCGPRSCPEHTETGRRTDISSSPRATGAHSVIRSFRGIAATLFLSFKFFPPPFAARQSATERHAAPWRGTRWRSSWPSRNSLAWSTRSSTTLRGEHIRINPRALCTQMANIGAPLQL